ncbi:hypothetical protein BXY57_1080 [Thermoflavifilum aggregans]|uniref:Uncharacterized protein n=2 Tax=Thermoflavifilum aggregans TaxID=454188 RepID=A0A2M9CUD5_9BACT|nr:hypothetical protein BXY57_1080 [Thermoflavifilum aggregans]
MHSIVRLHMRNSLSIHAGSLFLCTLLFITACHSSHQPAAPDRHAARFADLLALFPQRQLPYQVNQDSLHKPLSDSMRLLPDVVKRFFPDSIWQNTFPKSPVEVFPLAAMAYDRGHFLVIRVQQGSRIAAYLCYFDRRDQFHQALRLCYTSPDAQADQYEGRIDRKAVITIDHHIHTPDQRSILRENVYALNPEGKFILVLTNANGALSLEDIYNPIDTLPAHHPFSGDYVKGDMSIVSIRDGKNKQTFRFFIHFYDPTTRCGGELEGTGHFLNRSTGTFKDDNGPCAIDFHFTTGRVRIEEVGGCGAYRGIQCFFNGTYTKKKLHTRQTQMHK